MLPRKYSGLRRICNQDCGSNYCEMVGFNQVLTIYDKKSVNNSTNKM